MLSFGHPSLMGIVNVTPDSFSGDGVMAERDYVHAACDQALRMLADGADSLDIGGESSRPGAAPVSAEEEIRRVAPVVAAIRQQSGPQTIIAVDTVKAQVAEAALKAGASIINDISALRHDPAMAALVAQRGCPVILMHNRSQASAPQNAPIIGGQHGAAHYDDVVEDIKKDLQQAVDAARQAGIEDSNIILDPGIGFGKNVAQNLALIKHCAAFKKLGFPILLGPSRKSFIGAVLDAPVDARLEGTAAAIAIAAFLGADILRVHDVKFMARVAKMAAAIRDS